MARRNIRSRPGFFGTIYYYEENGNPIGKSRPGLFERTRVYTDQNGRYAGKSRPGFLVKEVFTDEEHNYLTSYEGIGGDVHFRGGVPIGRTGPEFLGAECTVLETADECPEEEYYGNGCFEDDLTEENEHHDVDCNAYNLQANRYTVMKNLRLLVLCLGISMVIALVYVIFRLKT
jgi:hypothetical protein